MGEADEADQEIEQIINKGQPNGYQDDESGQKEYDQEDLMDEEDQDQIGDEDLMIGEGNTPIHPDLIAAAQEMGLDLNSEQMRELQQFIVQQNIVDQSEEGDYDVEDARGDEKRQEKLQI